MNDEQEREAFRRAMALDPDLRREVDLWDLFDGPDLPDDEDDETGSRPRGYSTVSGSYHTRGGLPSPDDE